MLSSSFSTPELLAFQRSVRKGLVLCLTPLGWELGAPINGILVFGARWEPQVSHTQILFYCAASNLPAPGAVRERAGNVGFCSNVTFSGVRGCVCSPCVTAQSSGTTPRHPAASRGGECVGASTAALSTRLGFVGSHCGMAPQGKKVCLEPLQKAGSPSQIHGAMAMQGLQERSWWAGGSVTLLGKCWVIKGRFWCPINPRICQGFV